MAGDWIKMRHDLADDPAVIRIAERLGLDPDTIVGKLHRFWSWADRQLRDGNADGVTLAWLDRFVSVPAFSEMLLRVGWLEPTEEGFKIPNYERHLGKNAKSRALAQQRSATHRSRKSNADSVTKTSLEKRREEYTPVVPFEEFWTPYPKKQAKQPASKLWDKLRPDRALADRILARLAEQVRSSDWTKDGGQYIPLPSTYLHQRRWEDEGTTAAQTPAGVAILYPWYCDRCATDHPANAACPQEARKKTA